MTIVRWNPTRDVAALEEGLNRMVEGFYRRPQEDLNRGAWVPVVDIYNDQHELVLKAELPEMNEDEIDLTIEDNTLTLSGEKKLETEVANRQFRGFERRWLITREPSCCRRRSTPARPVLVAKAGVLTVRLPMRKEAKPNRIKVAVAA